MIITQFDSQIICLVSNCSPKEVRVAKVSASSAGYHLWHFATCKQLLKFSDIKGKTAVLFIDQECLSSDESLIGLRRIAKTLCIYNYDAKKLSDGIVKEVDKYVDAIFLSSPFDVSFDLSYAFYTKPPDSPLRKKLDKCPVYAPYNLREFIEKENLQGSPMKIEDLSIVLDVSRITISFRNHEKISINEAYNNSSLLLDLIPKWIPAKVIAKVESKVIKYTICISTYIPRAGREANRCFQVQKEVIRLNAIQCHDEDSDQDELVATEEAS